MKKITLLLFIVACYGQILPTVPANMFRITFDKYSMAGELNLEDQEFNMRGIGRSYFDDATKSELGYYNGAYDLYHVGDLLINEFVTIESYMKNFNSTYTTNLPVFGAGYYDTTRIAIPSGTLNEKKEYKQRGRNFRIDYGISNEFMLSLVVPNIYSMREEYSANATIDRIYGVDDLIDYHINAMAEIDSFFQTISFITPVSYTHLTLPTILLV